MEGDILSLDEYHEIAKKIFLKGFGTVKEVEELARKLEDADRVDDIREIIEKWDGGEIPYRNEEGFNASRLACAHIQLLLDGKNIDGSDRR